MHRWEIVRGTSIPFRTEQMSFANYEEAEIWILNHQLGRRNLLNPTEIRNVRGELYNRLKTTRGGDHKSKKSKCQNETLIGDAATEVAEKAGVSRSTVIRDGDRVKALENLTKSARKVAEQASDKDVKALTALSASDQNAVARAVRDGQARTIPDAIKLIRAKTGSDGRTGADEQRRTPGGRGKGKGKQKDSPATLVDGLIKSHFGRLARGLTAVAKANGGEGKQFKLADSGLNQVHEALMKMREGAR